MLTQAEISARQVAQAISRVIDDSQEYEPLYLEEDSPSTDRIAEVSAELLMTADGVRFWVTDSNGNRYRVTVAKEA